MKKHIFWGILFLLCAIFLIVDKLIGISGLSMVDLGLGALFVAMFINGLSKLSFGQILFSLAFLAIIFDTELGITELTPWTVLIVALLGTIGLNLIFGNIKARKKAKCNYYTRNDYTYNKDASNNPETFTAPKFYSGTNFSSSVKYVHADSFVKGRVECNFGFCEIFFDNVEGYQGDGVLKLEANFGKITVYVPSHWTIIDQTTSSFGSSRIKRAQPETGPVLTIKGEANFGGIEVVNA